MTDGTSDRFGILSIALQLVYGAADRPPGGKGLVFLAGNLPGLVDGDARGLAAVSLTWGLEASFCAA